jgi:amidase
MAKSASDLALALDLIAGPDDADALAYKLVLAAPRHTDLKGFRVLVVDHHWCRPPAPSASALAKIADRLAKRGVKVAWISRSSAASLRSS